MKRPAKARSHVTFSVGALGQFELAHGSENGGAILGHGSGGIVLSRAA